MKSILPRSIVWAGGLTSSHVSRRSSLSPSLLVKCTFSRHRSSDSRNDASTTKWRQHTLPGFSLPEIKVETPGVKRWLKAYVALGSNLGDRIGWIEQACREMSNSPEIKLVRTSSLWETDPMYVLD